MTNPGSITHDEILENYKAIKDINHEWTTVTVKEQENNINNARSNTHLNTEKIEKEYNIMPVKEAVLLCIRNYS
jgi:hypothetical protein